jgi:chromosome segregation ATPase
MVKKNYTVTAGILELPSGKCFEVGSQQWWNWISSSEAESFRFECDFGVKGYRARKEEIKSRSGSFWYAYKRVDGKLRKRYLGKSNELSLERLESAAYDLDKVAEATATVELPNKSVGNYLSEANDQLRASAIERENCYSQLLEQKIRLEKQVQELKQQLSELPNTLGNYDTATQDELKELQYRCAYLENENNRLTRLGQDYSKATVAKLHEKRTQALDEAKRWRESSESYQRQAAKLRSELNELKATADDNVHNQPALVSDQRHEKPVNRNGTDFSSLKQYKLHGRYVVRVEDLETLIKDLAD